MLLTTKNVVFQHLLPIYETIFEIFWGNFWPKMAIFGPPRQKFLPDATSEGPKKNFFFEKIIIHLSLPLRAKFYGPSTKTRKNRIGGAVTRPKCTRPKKTESMTFLHLG